MLQTAALLVVRHRHIAKVSNMLLQLSMHGHCHACKNPYPTILVVVPYKSNCTHGVGLWSSVHMTLLTIAYAIGITLTAK